MLVLQALLDNQLVVYGCTAWFDTFLCSIWLCVCLLTHIKNKVKLELFEDVATVTAGMAAWFFGNMAQSSLTQTNAFEVFYDGSLVSSS